MRGVVVPGLAMAASEVAPVDGVVVVENPEIGRGERLGRPYALEEVAELHARRIERAASSAAPLVLAGVSMGGMILAIIAARFRARLPARCAFHFLVTTANAPDLPAIPDALAADWSRVRAGVLEDFERVLAPFFAPSFRAAQPDVVRAYCAYRAGGHNRQSAGAYFRQVSALRACRADGYFAEIDPSEAIFVGGAQDGVLGPAHNRALARLCPDAVHVEVESLGHMVHIERPDLVRSVFDADIAP